MNSKLRFVALLAAAVLCLASLPVAAQSGGLRYSITVSEFENRAGWRANWSMGDAWGLVMTEKLHQSGRFIVLGETDMREAALDEQDFAASGRTAQGAKTPVTGQMTPAQILVKGAVTAVQGGTEGKGGGVRLGGIRVGGKRGKSEMNVTVYMVDSTTGQVLASTSVVGEAKGKGIGVGLSSGAFGVGYDEYKNDNVGRAMEDAIDQAVTWLVDQLESVPWTGSVALVRDGQVYINRGERDGVASGQTFVVGTADVIRDPDTGEVLDTMVKELARLQASSVREKLTICDVVSGSAAAVQKGMTVGLP